MQTQTIQSEISQIGHIKYHRRYPRYPVNQWPTINNNWKVRSDFYWWHFYLPFVQHSSNQLGDQNSLFGLTESLRGNQDIDMNQKLKTYIGYQYILQLLCAHNNTTKYWNWWTKVKEYSGKSQDNSDLILHNTTINAGPKKIQLWFRGLSPYYKTVRQCHLKEFQSSNFLVINNITAPVKKGSRWDGWLTSGETTCENYSITYFNDSVDNSILDAEGKFM